MKIESDGKTGTEIHISFPSVGEETE
jgi:hypothetical protein